LKGSDELLCRRAIDVLEFKPPIAFMGNATKYDRAAFGVEGEVLGRARLASFVEAGDSPEDRNRIGGGGVVAN